MQRDRAGELHGEALCPLQTAVQAMEQLVARIAKSVAQLYRVLAPPADKASKAGRGKDEFRQSDVPARVPEAVPYRAQQPVERDPRLLPAHVRHRAKCGRFSISRAVRRSRTGKHSSAQRFRRLDCNGLGEEGHGGLYGAQAILTAVAVTALIAIVVTKLQLRR